MKYTRLERGLLVAAWMAFTPISVMAHTTGGGWLGVLVEPPTGVRVGELFKGSPADKAGLQKGDVIIAVNGEEVASVSAFRALISGLVPESPISLKLLRDGQEVTVEATLTARAGVQRQVGHPMHRGPMHGHQHHGYGGGKPGKSGHRCDVRGAYGKAERKTWLGITMAPAASGIRIEAVVPKSPAELAGLKNGDIITAVGDNALAHPGELVQVIGRHAPGDMLKLAVVRDGEPQTISVELAAPPAPTHDPA